MKKLAIGLLLVAFASVMAFAAESDQLPANFLKGAKTSFLDSGHAPHGHRNGQAHARFGVGPGIDTLRNFNKNFSAPGVDFNNNTQIKWYYSMVGNPPELGGTTTFNAPIVPVDVDLRNFDGSPRFVNGQRLISHAAAFVAPTVNGPVFSNATYTSSPVPTQITDAVQRAEFAKSAKSDWHTMLAPSVKTAQTMVLIRGTYRFALNADGTCCLFVLVNADDFVAHLFPPTTPDNSTVIGASEVAGDITTKDISTFLFPDTYLYFNNDPNQCCVLGFHSFDFEAGDANNGNRVKFFVMNYSSWITEGLFGNAFTDVTATSHEIAETFNDPFVAFDGIHNIVPFWLAPNGNCQDDLEDGDVIEGLPNATFPVTMNGFTYHPQNEALLQWFEQTPTSDALHGAFSYPDETVLTAGTRQNFNCQ